MQARPRLNTQLSALALAAATVLAACGGGDATPPASSEPPLVNVASGTLGVAAGEITFTITFSEDVGSSFTADDISVSNGSKGAFTQLSPLQYTLVVTPAPNSSGTVALAIGAGSYANIVGNPGLAGQAQQAFDTRPPELTITSSAAGGDATGDVTFSFSFSKDVGTSFEAADITVSGGTAGAFTRVSETSATLVVQPPALAAGTLSVQVAAGAFQDAGGNANLAASTLDQPFDTRPPVVATTVVSFDEATPPELFGFGGAEDASVVVDPADAANKVARVVKTGAAELWAGTTVAICPNAAIVALPFSDANKTVSLRVWSPTAGIPVRLKVEDASDGAKSAETEALTGQANAWQTLTFNFASPAAGTAALNLANRYDKASVFFDFGRTGAQAGGDKTYYFDDLRFNGADFSVACPGTGGGGTATVLNFGENPPPTLTGFGGAEDSAIAGAPDDAGNATARVVKSATAELWAGTTISTLPSFAVPALDFSGSTVVTARVWAPSAGRQVRLKVENAADAGQSVETEATTTVAGGWQTLSFDFANPVSGTAAINPAFTYDKMSIFFDFGRTGAEAGGAQVYHVDDITWPAAAAPAPAWPTVSFSDAGVSYTLGGFGGAEDASIVADPAGGGNQVVRVVKSAAAELWAGTTVSTQANSSLPPIPFTASATRMTLRVWAPAAGVVVRLKVENAANAGESVETEATTTVAGGWETLTFDFANQAAGTAALNPAFTYNRASVFFDFGLTGAQLGGARTYYFDDLAFAP